MATVDSRRVPLRKTHQKKNGWRPSELLITYVIEPLMPWFDKTGVQPNLVTGVNGGLVLEQWRVMRRPDTHLGYLAALTLMITTLDHVDGCIARACGRRTWLGGVLDSFFDTLRMAITFTCGGEATTVAGAFVFYVGLQWFVLFRYYGYETVEDIHHTKETWSQFLMEWCLLLYSACACGFYVCYWHRI